MLYYSKLALLVLKYVLSQAVMLLHRGRAGGLPMSVLRAEVGALRRRVVLRGSNILDGRAIAQDLEQVLPRFRFR